MRAMRFAAGVQSTAGLGAGAPIRPATLHPGPEEEVYVESVVNYLSNYLRKKAHLRGSGSHVLLLVVVTLTCVLRASDESIRLSNAELITNQLNSSGFQKIGDADQFYDFATSAAATCFSSRSNGPNLGGQRSVAVGAFVIRQFRTSKRSIGSLLANAVSPNVVPLMGKFNASTDYASLPVFWYGLPLSQNLVSDPIVVPRDPNRAWLPNSMRGADDLLAPIRFDVGGRLYSESDPQYQLGPFSYRNFTVDNVTDALVDSQASGVWVTYASRVLVIETLWFNALTGYFFHGTNTLEVLGSGDIVATTLSYPFQPLVLRSSHPSFALGVGALVIDILLLICIFLVLYNVCQRVRLEARIAGGSIGSGLLRFWSIFDFMLCIMLFATTLYHFRIFSNSLYDVTSQLGLTPNQEAIRSMNNLLHIAYDSATSGRLKGWLFIATWLRTFAFLQYIPRLNIVTETARGAAHDLFGLIVIFLGFLGTFSVASAILFGDNLLICASVSAAYDYLAQLAGSGQVDDIGTKRSVSPFADALFIFYVFGVTAVLFNASIGYLANSFVNSSESFNLVMLNDWSPRAVFRAVKYVLRYYDETQAERDAAFLRIIETLFQELEVGTSYDVGAKEARGGDFAGGALQTSDGSYRSGVITLRQFRQITMPLISKAQAEVVFRKSQEQRGSNNATARSLQLSKRQKQQDDRVYQNIAIQTVLLADVKHHLFGVLDGSSATANGGDGEEEEEEGDRVLDVNTATAARLGRTADDAEGEEDDVATVRPMQAFCTTLQRLSAVEDRAADRAHVDATTIADRLEDIRALTAETDAALAVFAKVQGSQSGAASNTSFA